MATIVHFELPSADVERAKGFWSGVFGWTLRRHGRAVRVSDDPGRGARRRDLPSDEAGSGPVVYMATDDIDATLAKVGEAGGTAGEKQPIPEIGWFARCKDTEGNSFSLFQRDESLPASF